MFCRLCCCHLLSHPTLSTSLMLQLVVEAVIAFGSGVAGLSVPFPHAHSTHDCLHSSLPRFPHCPHGRWFLTFCCSPSRTGSSFSRREGSASSSAHRLVVCSSSSWPVDPRAEVRLFSPHTQAGILTQKSGMCFPGIFAVGCCWSISPVVSRAHCLCFGAVSSPCVWLAVGSNFILDHWGLPIHWMCSLLSTLGVVLSSVCGLCDIAQPFH